MYDKSRGPGSHVGVIAQIVGVDFDDDDEVSALNNQNCWNDLLFLARRCRVFI